MNQTEIRAILATRGLHPLRQLGQNFLHDQNLATWLVRTASADLPVAATVLEIGPGLGALTAPLLALGYRVIALEKDRGLCAYLREAFAAPIGSGQFELREGDALRALPELDFKPTLICGNLPYYISTPLLLECLKLGPTVRRLFFVVQREVAQRLASGPSRKDYGSLSVLVQARHRVKLARFLPGSVFYPAPEIQSAAVELVPQAEPLVAAADFSSFSQVVQRGFSQRRKKLSNLLPSGDSRRAEHLTPEEWVRLWREVQDAPASLNTSV